MIKEEQDKYIKLLLSGDVEAARKLAVYKKSLIEVWSSDSGYFKLLPHYLTMKMISNNQDSWKDSVKMAIQIAHENGFSNVNGNSREKSMSLVHAYILGYSMSVKKRSPDKMMDDLRELYKLGWRPQKITLEQITKNKDQSEWSQSSINELGFAMMFNLPEKIIQALLKVFPIDEPAHASGMNLMQYAAKELRSEFLGKLASLGGDYEYQGKGGFPVNSAKDTLKSEELWNTRFNIQRDSDTDLLKINDKRIWDGKIYSLITKLKIEREVQKEPLKKAPQKDPSENKEVNPHEAPVIKKNNRKRILND